MTTVKVLCILLLAWFTYTCVSVSDCPIRDHMSVIGSGMRVEGYWADAADDTSVYPWPCRAPEWSSRSVFIEKLRVLEGYARAGRENLSVITYLGVSRSRVDGSLLGSRQYSFHGRGGRHEATWPDSLLPHYIEKHGIRVSLEFEKWVMDFPITPFVRREL